MSLPVPNLDDRQFAALVQQATVRIPRYAPEWTDHNVHDPGVTFLELFAWLAEMQIYFLNQVPAKHELKFLRLLEVSPLPAAPAKVHATFALVESLDRATIPQGTPIAAPSSANNERIIFETDVALQVLPIRLEEVITSDQAGIRDQTSANEQEENFFFAFGENAERNSILYLGLEVAVALPQKPKLTLMVSLYERDLPPRGAHGDEQIDKLERLPISSGTTAERLKFFPSARLAWEYWNGAQWTEKWADGTPLLDRDGTCGLSWSGNLTFNWPPDFATRKIPLFANARYWLRAKVIQPGYEIAPRLESVRLHTVPATQGVTVNDEILGSSNGLPNQVFKFQHAPVLAGTAQIKVTESDDRSRLWKEVADFDASQPDDEHYVIDHLTGEVRFGDGVNGRVPPAREENIAAPRYRYGGGTPGNVAAETIQMILNESIEGVAVINKQAAAGGAEAERLAETRRRALRDLRTPYQAVTSADYEFLAKATPPLRVARAKALPLLEPPNFTPRDGIVTVAVAPFSFLPKPIPSAGFLRTVCEHLNRHRLMTTEVRVVPPDYVQVSVQATVLLTPRTAAPAVEKNIVAALNQFLHPLNGGVSGLGWEFGRSVYESEIIQVIESVGGVDCVMRVALSAQGNFQFDGNNLKLTRPHGLACAGDHRLELIDPEQRCEIKGPCHERKKQ